MLLPLWVWAISLMVILLLFVLDFVTHVRRAHEPTLKESLCWSVVYICLALVFDAILFQTMGHTSGIDFLAGFITEKSLSVDNLFVFAILMARFNVPAVAQQKALLIGILFALVIRGVLILIGGGLLAQFSWIFYLFGFFLIYSAIKLLIEECSSEEEQTDEYQPGRFVRFIESKLPFSSRYEGNSFTLREKGILKFTPLLLVVMALGGTDVMFALDSIPAIYGLTQDPYIVLMANAFALLGLVQLYFLLGNLLKKVVFLGLGLAVILAFIGIKLILHSLHENQLPFIHHGLPVTAVPEISTGVSLVVILGILLVTVVASLIRNRLK